MEQGDTCDKVSLEAYEDKTDGFGPETITWRDAASDPYKYFLYVVASNGDFASSGAKILIYDDKNNPEDIRMEVSEVSNLPRTATVGNRCVVSNVCKDTRRQASFMSGHMLVSFVY